MNYLFGTVLFCFAVFTAVGQSDKKLSAFTQSYAWEAKADYTKAISVLKEVYDAGSYETNLRLGWLYYSAGNYTESMSYYEKASALMPYSVEARLGYVYPASAAGSWDKVITQYRKVLETDPQNSTVLYRLGMIYYNRKEYQSAHKQFEKVVNLYPFGYDGLLMYAWSNFQLGKTREAKVLFNKVLLLSPGDKSATEGLGLIK